MIIACIVYGVLTPCRLEGSAEVGIEAVMISQNDIVLACH